MPQLNISYMPSVHSREGKGQFWGKTYCLRGQRSLCTLSVDSLTPKKERRAIFSRFKGSESRVSKFLQFSSVQSLSRARLFVTPWIAACKASLSITNSQSSLKLTSIESVMPSSHLILCRPLFLLPPIPPSIRVFSNESTPREVAKVLEFQL